MITLQSIQNSERLLLGAMPDRTKLVAVQAILKLRQRGEYVEIPAAIREVYELVKTSEIMLKHGAGRAAVDMHLYKLQTQPARFIDPTPQPTKGDIMSQIPLPAPQAPRPYAPQASIGPSPEERIKQAQEALAQAEQAKAQEDAQKALEARLDHEEALCSATAALLGAIRTFGHTPGQATSRVFAEFRKELTPLAESYGYKLVLVGDKTQATLTKL